MTDNGERGYISELADSFEGRTLTDRIAIVLMREWGRVEPDTSISKFPVSYVASFADMARAIESQFTIGDK